MIIASDSAIDESRRVMEICNACRYCEGLCATFQAMTLRKTFMATDLDYLANLCHNCTACFHDCQYAPPHAFAVNVSATLTDTRLESYSKYAWPGFLARLFQRNGLALSMTMAVSISLLLGLALALISGNRLFAGHVGPGAFYEIIGQGLMVTVAAASLGFSALAMAVSLTRYWRAIGDGKGGFPPVSAITIAMGNAATLKYMDGGHGEGCSSRDDGFSNQRRYYHQLTMWGFILCFASTCVAALYDYVLGWAAPYPFFSLPVLLGTIGGIGLLAGPVGLAWNKLRSDPRPMSVSVRGMDYAFLISLFMVSLTGLLLLILRDTPAMGMMLVIHLGFVLGFFISLPYSKFVHAIYRFAALVRFAEEKGQ